MYGLRRLTQRLESRATASDRARGPVGGARAPVGELPVGLLAAIAVDVFIDGLVLGAGFTAASRTGVLLAVALSLELVFLGLSAAGALLGGRVAALRTVAACAGVGLLLPVGTAIGVLALAGASGDVVGVMLGFGAVALMYLVTEELLSEAHEVPETAWATALFFVGFLIYLLIAEAIG